MEALAMSEAEENWMRTWCETFENDSKVKAWIEKNPPPPDWKGTPIQWAFTEMLDF
jgi:hypothetical protein